MGAVAKKPITQVMPGPATAVPWFVANESATAMRIISPKEVRQLSQFAAVIVLVPLSPARSKGDAVETTGNNSLVETSRTSVLALIEKRAIPSNPNGDESELVIGDVKVSFSSMDASRKGEPVKLTRLEFKTLKYFAQNPGRVIARDELLNQVWGYENYPCTRTVDNHILRLRKKLERHACRPLHFRTVHGVGYKFLP
jgi:two-component system, OmpR family, alkaline phosphatase synthesis response regulator PhoP